MKEPDEEIKPIIIEDSKDVDEWDDFGDHCITMF